MTTITDTESDAFIAGYCEAMLWANTTNADNPDDDSHAPSDWQAPDDAWQLHAFDAASQVRIVQVCTDFLSNAGGMLRQATYFDPRRTMAHHGHDLALTAAGHGTGFWDRGYPTGLGDALTRASRNYAAEAWFGADGIVHYEG